MKIYNTARDMVQKFCTWRNRKESIFAVSITVTVCRIDILDFLNGKTIMRVLIGIVERLSRFMENMNISVLFRVLYKNLFSNI